MPLTTTKTLTEQVAFKTPQDAIRAIQTNSKLKADVREIATSSDFQTLLKHLTALPRPFGIVVVTTKEN